MTTDGKRPSLGAILITRDEEANIAACLETLTFCDEIVVVDSGSTDRTVEIARSLGATVHVTSDWPGFGAQKQRALDRATTKWILSIDADERVSPALRDRIVAAVAEDAKGGYRIHRLSHFLGAPLRHGGWYPDPVLRLVCREQARFTPSLVHERIDVAGPVGTIEEPLIHYSYTSVDDVLRKMRTYALASAAQRRRDGVPGGLRHALMRSIFAFSKAYLFQVGFLDGGRGLAAAMFRAHETFWRYIAVGWERDP